MTDKALISEYTYRTLKSQREAFSDMPVFVLPHDLPALFRKTTRNGYDQFHCESLGVLAETENDFRKFIANAQSVNAHIYSREDQQNFTTKKGIEEHLVRWWRDARRKGSSKIGGERGAASKKAAIAEKAKDLTKQEWTNGTIKNAQLVEKYGVSINALKRYAEGKGWGHDRQRAIWTVERKANAKR